jgi:hypothetical protein
MKIKSPFTLTLATLLDQPRRLFPLAIAALTLGLCGCASTSSSSVKQVSKDPAYTGGPPQKVAVLAVEEREQYRAAVESHFNVQLNQHGQSAFVTYDQLSLPEIKADKPAAAAKLREGGADALLLVRLVNASSSSHEVRAREGYFAPTISGSDWIGWYDVAFMDMGTVWGGTDREVCLESSLFELKTGKRLWSGLTQTKMKEEADRIAELSRLVGKVLAAARKDGVVR